MRQATYLSRYGERLWSIKRSKAGHYFANQYVNGELFYSAYRRISGKHLAQTIGIPYSALKDALS